MTTQFVLPLPTRRKELRAMVNAASVMPDGRLVVDVAVHCDRHTGTQITYAAIGVRKPRRLTRWVKATSNVTFLPGSETTRLTLEAKTAMPDLDGRIFVSVYLADDEESIELGLQVPEAAAIAGVTAVVAACFWLAAGAAVPTAILLFAAFGGWRFLRARGRWEAPVFSVARLVRLFPAASLVAAIAVYGLAGGRSDLGNHAYGRIPLTPLLVLLFVAVVGSSVGRRGRFRALTKWVARFRDVLPVVRVAGVLCVLGILMSLAPSTKAAKLATRAFCRRQAAFPTVAHRHGHITATEARAAYAQLPSMRLSERRVDGTTFFDFITPDGRYSAGDLAVYATPGDAASALQLSALAYPLTGTPIGVDKVTLLQNVLLTVGRYDPQRDKCVLLGRLQRLR